MKKRTKITLRTKIYLAMVGLLALTGVLYASNPTVFVSSGNGVANPIGVAADPTHFFSSQYNDNQIRMVDCNGIGTLFGTLPEADAPLVEKYMAIAPAQSATAMFTPGDLFVTLREHIYTARPSVSGTFTLFADLGPVMGGCPFSDHSAITFDKVGTFGFNMIVTCENGRVWKIDHNGVVTHIVDTTTAQHITNIEGPAVLPASFGPLQGQIIVADDLNNNLYTVDSTGNVNYSPFGGIPGSFIGAEQVLVIPEFPCSYCGDRAFFSAAAGDDDIISYPLGDFTGFGGDILVTTEAAPAFGTFRAHFDVPSMSYQFFQFDPSAFFKEGSTFVEGSCPPSPTPTPTATFTPTSTPTATATFTPTATATFTPTATATSTPTATATATATATPTPTPTPTVTPPTCGTAFAIGDLDAVVGNHVMFWGAQWWKNNHLSGGRAPASFKGFVNCTNPNPPACGGTWTSDPGNSGHPPDTVPADMTVIVSSLITKSGPVESGNIPKMVTIHTDPGYGPAPGHDGTGTVTAVICGTGPEHRPVGPAPRPH